MSVGQSQVYTIAKKYMVAASSSFVFHTILNENFNEISAGTPIATRKLEGFTYLDFVSQEE